MARILMVNDEKDLLALCQETLQESGHEVEVLTNGAKAVECARRWKPNLMVIDWVMPDMDGHTIMTTLKSLPDTKAIPVLMMSALRDGATRAKLVGAKSFLAKPFSADDLLGAVNELLRS
jgi:DNA-binding response OmpR family regulator